MKADARKRGLFARSCARVGRKDVVGEVKNVDLSARKMMESTDGRRTRSAFECSVLRAKGKSNEKVHELVAREE